MLFLPQGFNDRGMRIESEHGVEYIVVNFRERGQWFTDEEEQQLKYTGIRSLFGYFLKKDDQHYSIACCGENNLFRCKDDFDLYLKNSLLS